MPLIYLNILYNNLKSFVLTSSLKKENILLREVYRKKMLHYLLFLDGFSFSSEKDPGIVKSVSHILKSYSEYFSDVSHQI